MAGILRAVVSLADNSQLPGLRDIRDGSPPIPTRPRKGRAIAFGETVGFLSSVIPACAGMTATERSENPNTIALRERGVGVFLLRSKHGKRGVADIAFACFGGEASLPVWPNMRAARRAPIEGCYETVGRHLRRGAGTGGGGPHLQHAPGGRGRTGREDRAAGGRSGPPLRSCGARYQRLFRLGKPRQGKRGAGCEAARRSCLGETHDRTGRCFHPEFRARCSVTPRSGRDESRRSPPKTDRRRYRRLWPGHSLWRHAGL